MESLEQPLVRPVSEPVVRVDALENEALHSTFHRLETRWHQPIGEPSDSHGWDPLPFWMFFDGIRECAALIPEGRRFLDVGCGIGTKLSIMFHLGWTVSGIELRREYVESARELIPEATIVHADAFDVEQFDADVVYMYRPMKSEPDEDRLEAHVRERAASGTVLFFPTRSEVTVA
jgi:SAM-dependent methyltransferase